MKKIFTLSLFIMFVGTTTAQILSRIENWPNASWTVTGSYTPAALVLNPTVDNKLKYDASLVVPLGNASNVFIASPVFSLKPAFDGGEKAFKMDFDVSLETLANFVLTVQYWNADTSTWVVFQDGDPGIQIIGDFTTCTNAPVTLFFDFSTFTTNQLLNFRYRFSINDTAGNGIKGFCLSSPILTSFSCSPPPSSLTVSGISPSSANLDWTGSPPGAMFEVEYGLLGFTIGTGIKQQTTQHPFGISGLTPNTTYSFYVREDCSQSQIVYSTWAGPRSFRTTTLGLEEHKLKGFKLYPNPIKDIVWMESEKALNEVKNFNLTGQELMNIKPSKLNSSLDLSSLSDGFYFIKVTTDTDSGTYKILKE